MTHTPANLRKPAGSFADNLFFCNAQIGGKPRPALTGPPPAGYPKHTVVI
ncbi:MAG: hypothetical protein WEB85_06925 [Dongiaceae bacterium]